jgi:hypothetical protein
MLIKIKLEIVMKKIMISTVAVLLLSSGLNAQGQEDKAYNMDLKVGTLGIGVDVSTPINDNVGLRFNINGATSSRQKVINNINYDATLKLLTAGALLDYYPSENNFRFTAGAYYNNNQFDLVATPALSESITIGGVSYTGAEVGKVNANVTFNKIAPYVGLGWGNKASSEKGWGFTFDIGAMYQGTAIATANATINSTLPQILKNQIVDSVEKERQQIESDMSSYTWYPVIMIGVNYTF